MLADDTKQKPPPELITAGAHSHCVRMDGSRLGGIEPRCRAKDPLEDQIPLKRFSQGQPLGIERGTEAHAPLIGEPPDWSVCTKNYSATSPVC